MNYKNWPLRGWIGLILVSVFWILNWSLTGLRTHWGFFPLWLGYCLTVDSVVYIRKGTSLFSRNRIYYFILFLISAPAWWLFEFLNSFTHNWLYVGKEYFTDLEYTLLATLSFSTVMPAVFGTAELAGTFSWIKRMKPVRHLTPSNGLLLGILFTGCLMLLLLMNWPLYFFPFLWASVYLIIEPVNYKMGNHSLLKFLEKGRLQPILALSLGCLICGFFWEFWNYFSYPKWIYKVPFIDFLHIFEMPLLGYLGYLTFPLELYAIYQFIMRIFRPAGAENYLKL